MIASLRGMLVERAATDVIVEVAGVGYRVVVAPATSVALGDAGEEVFVHVHHHVREDAQTLFGFATRAERACFEALLGAHGVGPGLALAILSVHAPDALRLLVADDDVGALCLVPGVGAKTAARLLIELKSRLDVAETGPPSGREPVMVGANGALSARSDVREALAGLGYDQAEVRAALAELPDDDDPALLLKGALRRLGARR